MITDHSGAHPPEDHQHRHESKGRSPCGQAASGALNLSPSGFSAIGQKHETVCCTPQTRPTRRQLNAKAAATASVSPHSVPILQ
eukprot:2119059-Prymnesium_polylepis.1